MTDTKTSTVSSAKVTPKKGTQKPPPPVNKKLLNLSFIYSSAFFKPEKKAAISNLPVTVKTKNGTHKLRTNVHGELPPLIFDADTAICDVSVTLPTGEEVHVSSIVLDRTVTDHSYISPYTVKKIVTEVHDGKPPEKTGEAVTTGKITTELIKNAEAVGTVSNTRSQGGNPVTITTAIGECFDKTNTARLKLGSNVIYRDYLMAASNRSGINAQAIATLISIEAAGGVWVATVTVPPHMMTPEEKAAEAAAISQTKAADAAAEQKEKDDIEAAKLATKPQKGAKTEKELIKIAKDNAKARENKWKDEEAARALRDKPKIYSEVFGMWNPKSVNTKKDYPLTAAGLTQFIAGTWIDQAMNTTTFLHEKASAAGCIKLMKNPDTEVKGGKAIPLTPKQIAENKKITQDNAKISDKSKHKAIHQAGITKDYVIAGKGESWQVVKGKLNELYDMRFNPEISIMASIDYAVYNLKEFTKSYNDPKVLENHANKAKIMYLTHHLGLGDARKFMANTIKEEDTPVLGKDGKPRMYKGKPVVINGAETLLRAQFKGGNPPHPELADAWYKANNDNWIWAHRSWLITLIDTKVVLEEFGCEGAKLPNADKLFDVIKTLGGKHPEGFVVRKIKN